MAGQVADAFTLVAFFLDAAIVAATGWLLVRSGNRHSSGIIETGLSWLLASVLVVAASGAVLGECGGFNAAGFMAAHAFILVLVAVIRRRALGADRVALASLFGDFRAAFRPGDGSRWLLLLLGATALALALLAAMGEPLVYDALTYRLPRIAQWLQDGRIAAVDFDDQRLNYMSNGQDLIVAWLVGAFSQGFRFTALAQVAGGTLLVGATMGIARHSGLGKFASVAAALLTFGFANLAPQWTSAHNDLFAAGIFAAGFDLFWVALRRGEGSVLAGLAIAFALEAKGTIFYVLPSAGLWVLWLAWRARPRARAWIPTFAAGLIGLVAFVGPPFFRNHQQFGRVTAPAEALQEHYGPSLSVTGHLQKLGLNLRTEAVQLLDPFSQPWGVRDLTAPLAQRIAGSLPDRDPYSFEGLDRRENIFYFLCARVPNPDFASFGVIPLALMLAGMLVGALSRRGPARCTLVWGGGIILFLLVENALLQWHPWEFRYSIIVAPWLAVVGAWAVEALPALGRTILWTFLLASGFGTLAETTLLGDQVGWQAWTLPRQNGALGQHWRNWALGLAGEDPSLRVAVGTDRPISWLSRLGPGIKTRLESLRTLAGTSAEAAANASAGWLVVPASQFAGREGRVMGRTFLDRGDAANDLSLAAYRTLQPGEAPSPIIYRNVVRPAPAGFRCELRIRSWTGKVKLQWAVPAGDSWRFVLQSGTNSLKGELGGDERSFVVVPAGDQGLTDLTIDVVPTDPSRPAGVPPVVVAILPTSS
ncbi:MAG TPA: hypothetical protein VGM73_00910 [Candidatus Didemnitutus sp.]|jgi:hypothetical protein